jgi:acyl-CoA thioester hydrolase
VSALAPDADPGGDLAPSAYPVHRRVTTRWADNDHYGHVNNVVYYEWFDTAVNGWLLEAAGCDIRDLPAVGVVAETSCTYLRELSFPDTVTVGIRLARRGRSSVVYGLGVFREVDGHPADPPCALGRFVHVYVDATSRRPVAIPTEVAHALDTLAKEEIR